MYSIYMCIYKTWSPSGPNASRSIAPIMVLFPTPGGPSNIKFPPPASFTCSAFVFGQLM